MSDLFTNRDIFQLLLSSFSRFSAFLPLPPRLTRCPFVSEASLPPPLMNQHCAHPEWREPINRCENGRFVENCIRTTDIFCQFPPRWRHSAQPLGTGASGGTFLMHLLQKKELDHSEQKTPLKPWTFPTSAFRQVKRRRG